MENSANDDQIVKAYWELTDEERSTLSHEVIGEDEGFVLWKINHGRRLLAMQYPAPYDLRPRQMEVRPGEPDECNYYDAIAALLIAGAHDGFDPAQLCADALEQQESLMADGRVEARQLR